MHYKGSTGHAGNLHEFVDKVVEVIRVRKLEFDFVAVKGISGLTIGPVVAYLLGKGLCVINSEDTPSPHRKLECIVLRPGSGTQRYIIVDDFVDSGRTVKYIKDMLYDMEHVDTVLYDSIA